MFGQKLKSARKAKGYSLRSLADKVGISHNAIAKYENQKDVPGSVILLKISKLLDVPFDYFFREENYSISSASFRKRHKFGKKRQGQVLHSALIFLENYLQIEELSPGSNNPFQKPKCIPKVIEEYDEIENFVLSLRQEWELGVDPIWYLIEELERRAVKIVFLDIEDEGFDGFSAWINKKIPAIGIAENWPGQRQRFTIAHELGHLLLSEVISDNLKIEKLANRFAGAFLVPEQSVKQELGEKRTRFTLNELKELKKKYGVSIQSWLIRAKDLHIISDSFYRQIMIDFARKGWKRNEPGEDIDQEKPRRLERLVFRALMENILPESKAAEILQKSIPELRRSIMPLRGNLADSCS